MYFSFTDEQKLLKESVDRFLENEYPFDTRRAISTSDAGFSDEMWGKFAELGWLGLGISDELGGLGGSAVETSIVMEGLGHACAVEPYATTLAIGATVVSGSGNAHAQALLSGVAEGKTKLALAVAEPQSRFNLANVETTATASGVGFRLSGKKSVVFDGEAADHLIVVTRTSGNSRDPHGLSLFLVDTDQVERRGFRTIDGRRAAEITIDCEIAGDRLLGEEDAGFTLLQRGVDAGIVAICAEAVGAMKYLHDATLEYLRTRTQFGQPLASFQALQHRVVDMFVAYELSRSMAYMAAVRSNDSEAVRRKAVSAAKVQIGQAGRHIGEEAIQLHGGMGMTDELPVGHYFKRLTMIDRMFGDVDHHLAAVAATA